jgi:hypothetical protein
MSESAPGPVPAPDWNHDDPDHPGFLLNGVDNTPGPKAYYIHLQAKPGQEDALQRFLADINAGVDQEPLTGPWFALRFSQKTFGSSRRSLTQTLGTRTITGLAVATSCGRSCSMRCSRIPLSSIAWTFCTGSSG